MLFNKNDLEPILNATRAPPDSNSASCLPVVMCQIFRDKYGRKLNINAIVTMIITTVILIVLLLIPVEDFEISFDFFDDLPS